MSESPSPRFETKATPRGRLRILHLSESDIAGGANRAAFRLHRALRDQGVMSTFHPGRKLGNDLDVVPAWPVPAGRFRARLSAWRDARAVRAYPGRSGAVFSPVGYCYGRPQPDLVADADVVCLHWIAASFLHPADLVRLKKPLVWRLSDLWPMTGGCHFPGACRAFETQCGRCPALGSDDPDDLAGRGFAARAAAYPQLDLTVVAPSRWIADEARRSALFRTRRIEHIPTGVDLSLYRPQDRTQARARLGLPDDGVPILLFGAIAATQDRRKGFAHLQDALRLFAASSPGAHGVVFGGDKRADEDLGGLTLHHIGRIDDEARLAALYAAADVLVAPFVEDNLPNVILEALACGTPVAAFDAGGVADAVDHEVNGYLAPTGSAKRLTDGIAWTLQPELRPRLREAARQMAEDHFDIRTCARRYLALFAELAGQRQVQTPAQSQFQPRLDS